MFTGLVEEIGIVAAAQAIGDGMQFTVKGAKVMGDLDIDDSVSVNGCCLTVTSRTADTFSVTAVQETLKKTTIGTLVQGSRVNLERALAVGERLGGHFVQGHVDATGTVRGITKNTTGWEIWISFPANFRKWVIPVGSIAVNGVSLTVADLEDAAFKVAIIPHTLDVTMLADLAEGSVVNLEFDVLGKYVENCLKRV